jgi:hypothetical protein
MNSSRIHILDDSSLLISRVALRDTLTPHEIFSWCKTHASAKFQKKPGTLLIDYIQLAPEKNAHTVILLCATTPERISTRNRASSRIKPWFCVLINSIPCEKPHTLFTYNEGSLLYFWAINNNTLITAECISSYNIADDLSTLIKQYQNEHGTPANQLLIASHEPCHIPTLHEKTRILHRPFLSTDFENIKSSKKQYCPLNLAPWRKKKQRCWRYTQCITASTLLGLSIFTGITIRQKTRRKVQHAQRIITQKNIAIKALQQTNPTISERWAKTQKIINQWRRITNQHILLNTLFNLLPVLHGIKVTKLKYNNKNWALKGVANNLSVTTALSRRLKNTFKSNTIQQSQTTRNTKGQYAFIMESNIDPKK